MALDRRQVLGWSGLLLAAVLALAAWLFVALMAARPEFRAIIDTTPGQTVSVTPGTEAVIKELRERPGVHIEIYTLFEPIRAAGATPETRALIAIYRRIETLTVSLLRQYAALGGEKLQVRYIDIRRDPDKTRQILERLGGVNGHHVVVVAVVREKEDGKEAIQKKVIPVRDLAVIDAGGNAPVPGGNRSMPRLEDYTGEEQFSSAMKTLLAGGTPTVYLIKGHNEELATNGESPYDYTNLRAGLEDEGFKVSDVNLREEGIPKDATVLASLEPKSGFLEAESKLIHDWLRSGGRLFVNLSYHEVASQNPTFAGLLGPLGIRVGSQRVSQLWNNAPASEAAHLEIKPRNTALPITRDLVADRRTIGLLHARPILEATEPVPDVSLDGSLLRTDPLCWLAERDGVASTSNIPIGADKSFSVGAIATVKPTTGEHPGRVILISGAGFNNNLIERGSQKDFVLNCFAWLAERREHVGVGRDKGPLGEVIQRSSNPDDVARLVSRSHWLLVIGVPTGFFVLGLFVWWRRRRL